MIGFGRRRPGGAFVFAAAGTISGAADDGAGEITLSPGAPAGVVVGSFLALHVCVNAPATTITSFTTPTGWTAGGGDNNVGDTVGSRLFYRWATGEAADTPSVVANTDATGSYGAARIYRFTGGIGSGDPRDDTTFEHQAASTTLNAVDITTTVNNSLACQFVSVLAYVDATGAFTGESGVDYTEAATANTTVSSDMTLQLQTGSIATAGAITGGTYTLAASKMKQVIALGLKPA